MKRFPGPALSSSKGPALAGLLLLLVLLATQLCGQVSEGFITTHRDRLDRLFSQLDQNNPGTADAAKLWQGGRAAEAATVLCAYYRSKTPPLDLLEPALIPEDVMKTAAAALEGSFHLLNQWEQAPLDPDESVDWLGRGSRNDKERAWMLNRHAFLLDLAEAHKRSGDTRFRESLNTYLRDWILDNPYPERLSFSPPWRALEVARRILNSWVYVFYGYTALDDETRLLVLCSLLDHADSLSEHASFWGGNHLITEKMALLTLAVAWPEFRASGDWKSSAIRDLSREFLSQTYPDGSYKELSNHYQRVVLTNAMRFVRLIGGVRKDTQESPVMERIEQMWDFFAGVMRPDGLGPLNNAADHEDNAAFVREIWQPFGRPDWLYAATNGREGTPPAEGPSRLFPWAGQAILRTGWERDAGWVYFDAGPYGTAHQHVDRLHVSASLNGRPILVDNGRYIYQPGAWKDYFQGPASHNILLLDGQPAQQAPREVAAPLPVVFTETDTVAFAAASARFNPPATHPLLPSLSSPTPWTRAVLLDKQGRFVLILDHLTTFRPQSWVAKWHFDPDLTPDEAEAALSLAFPDDPVRSVSHIGSAESRIAGWHSPRYNEKLPAVQIDFSGTLDRPRTLVWLLQSPGPARLTVEVLSKPGSPVLHLRVSEDDRPVTELEVQVYPEPILLSCTVF